MDGINEIFFRHREQILDELDEFMDIEEIDLEIKINIKKNCTFKGDVIL